MTQEGLDDEVLEFTAGLTNLLVLVHALVDPFFALSEVAVDLDQTEFSASLDQLIGFYDEALLLEPRVLCHEFRPVGRLVYAHEFQVSRGGTRASYQLPV